MKIGIVQIYDNNIKSYAEYSSIININYAIQHGYQYFNWDYDLVPCEYSVYYNKLLALLKAMWLKPEIDWFLYMDSDAIVTNKDITIESIIQRHFNKDLIFANGSNGQSSGVFLIKNTPGMQNYLTQCYKDKRFFHTKYPEQNAMFNLILESEELQDITGWEPSWFFNACADIYTNVQKPDCLWNEKSFILHLACIPNHYRKEIFQKLLQNDNIYCFTNEDKGPNDIIEKIFGKNNESKKKKEEQ